MFLRRTFLGFLLLSLFNAGIAPARATTESAPLLRIGKTSVAPIIDGQLDDAAWKQSIVVKDFSVTGSKKPANQQTQVRFISDDRNLYISWYCAESLLAVLLQRMHEVKVQIRERDGDVFSDDCLLLFLRTGNDDTVYEFDLNSIGTLFDARSNTGDLWKTRDASWNSNARSAARREDGFWAAEMAIPWKAFGLDAPPAIGTSWGMSLQRRAVGRNESSSWPLNDSEWIHSLTNWGELVFDETVPQIHPGSLPVFEAGKSNFVLQATQSVEITAQVGDTQNPRHFSATGTREIQVPLTANAPKIFFQWNAGTGGKYFYRSPLLELLAQSSVAHLKISTEKGWKLYLNGELSREGEAGRNQDVAFPLANGVNDIVVEAQSGQASLQLTPPFAYPDEKIVWRMHAAGDNKALIEIDRRAWTIAPEDKGVVGTAGAPVFLQHTLLYKNTLTYPVVDPAFYIAQGVAQQITFLAEGVEGIRLDDWQMTLAIPSEFEVLGSSGFYGNIIKDKPRFNTTRGKNVVIDGHELNLYYIAADKPINYKPNQPNVLSSFEVLVRLPQTISYDADKPWKFYYWATGNKSSMSEAPQEILVRALPPLKGKQPQKFIWQLYADYTYLYDNPSVVKGILQSTRQAGFTKYLTLWNNRELTDLIHQYGLKAFSQITFTDGRTRDLNRAYLAQHPEDALIDKHGKPSDAYICTSQLLGTAWPIYEKSIAGVVITSGVDAIDYDYEFPPFNPPHACFCERCLEALRDFSHIDTQIKLTPAVVQQEYKNQWINFMAYRAAILLKKMQSTIHAANPNVLFTAYSGYYDAKDNFTKASYGIDWNLVGQMQAVDRAGMGYGRPLPAVTDSIKALRGIPVIFGELLMPNEVRSRQPVVPLQPATLLRRALDATGGVLIFTRRSMEGRSWQAVAELTRLTADYEDIFLNKSLQEIPGQDPASVQIARGAGKTLLCLMNSSPVQERVFSFQIPEGLGVGKEYYSGQATQGGQVLFTQLMPGEVKVFVFER